jgi:hypothetical protein
MKHTRVQITDHAVLRYMERAMGLDVEALRQDLERKLDAAARCGACGLTVDGVNFRIVDGVVTTVLEVNKRDVRFGPKRRGRAE